DAIRETARKAGFVEREVLTSEQGFDWQELIDASRSLSLFSPRKLIDFRIPSGKVGAEGAKILQAYCENLQPDVITLITLPKLDRQALASKWFEALESAGVAVTANTVEREALPAWIAQRLSAQKQRAEKEALGFLAESVEGNLLAAHQEIRKLGLLYPEGDLSFDEVKRAVLDVARYDIFQLGEAMLSNNARRFARILEGLKGEGVAESLVLWQLADDFRAIHKFMSGIKAGKQPAQALRDARIWGARANLVQKAGRRMGIDAVDAMLARASLIDMMIKGLRKGDVWDELLQLGLNFAADGKNG
ncbi:MAG TPA: DNA polymerase III subunit delta, partial [Burkholderiales bacterium]|nr:DNA polymerase III subunit delta [Burkholderiales bacterium]